ncbi:MAG: monovalent cation/H(+) antiporter subunit G [Candidatus Omnitrophica bacterium]|nr:monovalent cation/H(+) antiporter subunit G [Candidatus Omnitrophota bacterium]MBU1870082.1 monovalent cation/H(+) antiporter subunit G [Candidatus Omnitrophota bacterium]
MNEIAGMVFIIIGLVFDFFGCLGLLRLPDVYNRLHASIKCVTLGTSSILFGLFLYKGFTPMGIKALLCILFLVLTAPVSAHVLSRSAHKAGVKLWEKSVCDEYEQDKK